MSAITPTSQALRVVPLVYSPSSTDHKEDVSCDRSTSVSSARKAENGGTSTSRANSGPSSALGAAGHGKKIARGSLYDKGHGGGHCQEVLEEDGHTVDFIASSSTVKHLFALPYAASIPDRGVTLALHNLGGGTLLLDSPGNDSFDMEEDRGGEGQAVNHTAKHDGAQSIVRSSILASVQNKLLSILSSDEHKRGEVDGNSAESSSSFSKVTAAISSAIESMPRSNSLIQTSANDDSLQASTNPSNQNIKVVPHWVWEPSQGDKNAKQYLKWKFHDMTLLVASDALIYMPQSYDATESATNAAHKDYEGAESQALTVRIADVQDLRNQWQRHERMLHSVAEKRALVVDAGHDVRIKPTYADAVLSAPFVRGTSTASKIKDVSSYQSSSDEKPCWSLSTSTLGHAVKNMTLQNCVIPSVDKKSTAMQSFDPRWDLPSHITMASSPTPLYTCLDAYLDNIMANVPQLALCLEEKGFIQSVKLLRTEDIPTSMFHSSTLSVDSCNFVSCVDPTEHICPDGSHSSSIPNSTSSIFSPTAIDLNATMLLRFLKENCSSENTTYLLRRDPGQPNIQLYDVTSISSQRQRKWTWWLAMMSYRFALKLLQHSSAVSGYHPSLRRAFRERQRSLLKTSLDLLEELADMDGGSHETICAAVNDQLADSFLRESEGSINGTSDSSMRASAVNSSMGESGKVFGIPYGKVSSDGLSKAQDYILQSIKTLTPLLGRVRADGGEGRTESKPAASINGTGKAHVRKRRVRSRSCEKVCDSDGGDKDTRQGAADLTSPRSASSVHTINDSVGSGVKVEALSSQLYALHQKLVYISLRLAEHHFEKYWSSSAMQALRMSATQLAHSVELMKKLGAADIVDNQCSIETTREVAHFFESTQWQYTCLWEYCGNFAHSFAADPLWRDRGHSSCDDVISLLREVECVCESWAGKTSSRFNVSSDASERTNGMVNLQSLRAVFSDEEMTKFRIHLFAPSKIVVGDDARTELSTLSYEAAIDYMKGQSLLKRDKLQVLVASAVSYSRAKSSFRFLIRTSSDASSTIDYNREKIVKQPEKSSSHVDGSAHSGTREKLGNNNAKGNFLQKRYGDSCNEIGKMLLSSSRDIITSSSIENNNVSASALLKSAEFWFREGMEQFMECGDLCNVALLRCNLCQCCKIKVNAHVALSDGADPATYAETCLQEGAEHLRLAHNVLGNREVDARTWDMVSEELAATLLVLGVRRRQTLLGRGVTSAALSALRLSDWKVKSIVQPMKQALEIYENIGNLQQTGAAHYQLALFYSKVWKYQRDELAKDKLFHAFNHYAAAQGIFSSFVEGNEPTFVILCIDLSNLCALVSGPYLLEKAVTCCLDTCVAFSPASVAAAMERAGNGMTKKNGTEWLNEMTTLAEKVEETLFKLLRELVRLEKQRALQQEHGIGDPLTGEPRTGDPHIGDRLVDRNTSYEAIYRAVLVAKMELKESPQHSGANSSGDGGGDAVASTGRSLNAATTTATEKIYRLLFTVKTYFPNES